MKFRFSCLNYRGLRSADFEPEGVCALVGANGSGKSTLLAGFEFVRNLYLRPTESAISLDGGHWGLRSLNPSSPGPTDLVIRLGGDTWIIQLHSVGSANEILLDDRYIFHDGEHDAESRLDWVSTTHFQFCGAEFRRGEGSSLKLAWELTQDPAVADLVKFVNAIRTYRHYKLFQLREHGSRVDSDLHLSGHGNNLFAVLRNWRDRRELRFSYDFVIESLRAAFPDFFEDLEFNGDSQTVKAKVFLAGIQESMPVAFVPDGLLVAMLHLAAVAGSPGNSFVAIDDFENYLHPFAIRSLIESFRGLAERRNLCILLATHSPVALDEFRADPSKIFVMDLDPPNKPIALNHLRDPEWLKNFSLGDLYSQLEFGARVPSIAVDPAPNSTAGSAK